MARGTQDRRTLATVLLHRCWALDGPGDVGDSLTVAGEILAIGAELGDPALTLEGLRIQLAAQFENGSHSAAVQTAREMKTLAEAAGHPEFIRLAAMWDIVAATMEGRFGLAEELAGELGRRLDQIGHSQAQLISVAQSAAWRLLQGYATEYIGAVRGAVGGGPRQPRLSRHHGLVPGRGGRRGPGGRAARPDRSGFGGERGQELPVVGDDRGLLRRGRPGRRPAVGGGAVRSGRAVRGEQLHAGGGELPRRGRPLAGGAGGGDGPLLRGRPRTSRPRWRGIARWAPGRGRRSPRKPTGGCCRCAVSRRTSSGRPR